MEIQIVKWVQSLNSKFFDAFFLLCTQLGEELFFFMAFSLIFWCFSKKSAMKIALFYGISAMTNFVMKSFIKRPRPYMVDSSIMNKKAAIGTSFPSGHSQCYAVLTSSISFEMHKKRVGNKSMRLTIDIAFIIGAILVIASRMYLGQHYLTDTLAGLMIGVGVAYLCAMAFEYLKKKITANQTKMILFLAGLIGSVALLIAILLGVKSKNLYKYAIIAITIIFGYLIEDKFVQYHPNKEVKQGVIKTLLGYTLVGIVVVPIKLFVHGNLATYLVCLLCGLFSTLLIPLLFKFIFQEKRDIKHEHV